MPEEDLVREIHEIHTYVVGENGLMMRVKSIEALLQGNGKTGLISEMKDYEKRFDSHIEGHENVKRTVLGMAVAVGGGVGSLLTWLLDKLWSH